jgi:putative membrane protein
MAFFKEINMDMEWIKPAVLLGSVMYALMGVIIFWLCFIIIDKITPYNLWEEIVEKQNKALGMVVAAMSLGICIIVAAAIHG